SLLLPFYTPEQNADARISCFQEDRIPGQDTRVGSVLSRGMSVMPLYRYMASISLPVLFAVVALGDPGSEARNAPVKVSAGPLKGLPSTAGAHGARIQAMGDNTWLALGKPDPDPTWGSAPGRSWCCTMPFVPGLRGAFLYGEGRHGFTKPDGRYMDDCWFYDLNAHRWVCIYPGTPVKEPGLQRNADGFPTGKDG